MTTLTVGKEPLREKSTVTVACYHKFVVYNIQVFWYSQLAKASNYAQQKRIFSLNQVANQLTGN